ncbi:MAG TPA: hypothetical protein VEL47_06555 [Myxococcota bacterium]|nr:hypothetical protein [Myxococcota bacterium]
MWVLMNERYRQEKEQYRLKECCEDCRHFCETRKKCEMLYPVKHHLKETFVNAKSGDRIYFCKMFEAA